MFYLSRILRTSWELSVPLLRLDVCIYFIFFFFFLVCRAGTFLTFLGFQKPWSPSNQRMTFFQVIGITCLAASEPGSWPVDLFIDDETKHKCMLPHYYTPRLEISCVFRRCGLNNISSISPITLLNFPAWWIKTKSREARCKCTLVLSISEISPSYPRSVYVKQ